MCEAGTDTCDKPSTECVAAGLEDFYCKCRTGYILETGVDEKQNKKACIKKDACTEKPCDEKSTECVSLTETEYYCKCRNGFKLQKDMVEGKNKKQCLPDNACILNPCPTNSTKCQLKDTNDEYYCSCLDGYKLKEGVTDVKENKVACLSTYICSGKECPAASTECVPNGADFFCKCLKGYKLKSGDNEKDNKKECQSTYQCKDTTCPKTTKCVAKGDDFYCDCLSGYALKTGMIKETNKEACASTFVCDKNPKNTCPASSTKCVPEGDSFYCECLGGYKLKDGKTKENNQEECLKKDKCDDNPQACAGGNSKCTAIEFTDYYCKCNDGYKPKSGDVEKNKQDCIKKTVCEDGNDICPKDSTKCVVKKEDENDYYCECLSNYDLPEGVKKEENKQACTSGCDTTTCFNGGKCEPRNKNYNCKCTSLYTGKNCENATCSKNPCKNDGNCTVNEDKSVASCDCVGEWSGPTCELHSWCEDDSICKTEIKAKKAECKFDNAVGVGYCKCNEDNLKFDYSVSKKCIAKPPCLSVTCADKNKECKPSSGKCECRDGYKPDEKDNTKCVFAGCQKQDACFTGSTCKQRASTDSIECSCNSTQYYTSGNKCIASTCLISNQRKNTQTPCQDTCPGGMERIEGQCKPVDENKKPVKCDKPCGLFGYCNKRGEEEVCDCIDEATEVDGKCVLKQEVCPDGVELTQDKLKCDCKGKFKLSSNRITCDRRTCNDKEAQQDCQKRKGICDDNWMSASGYRCNCRIGYSVDEDGVCRDKCSIRTNINNCLSQKKLCFLDEEGNVDCKCPPGLVGASCNGNAQQKTTFIINSLAVSSSKYVKSHGIDAVTLSKDVIEAMKMTFQNLQFARLFKYSLQGDVVNCSVWLQFKKPAEFDYKRVKLQAFTDGFLLPGLQLSKEKFQEVKEDTLYLCSGLDNDPFCGGAKCIGSKCSCPEGYKPAKSSVFFKCEDVNECSDGSHTCPTETTSCVNTEGSFYCKCLTKYKLKKDVTEIQNQEACIDACKDPNPCNSGQCSLTENGMVDCSCNVGQSGSYCTKTDVALAGANKKTVVVGAVLGTFLGIFIIAVVVYVIKQRKNSYSEDFSPAPPRLDNAEMTERRPMRGISNRAYQ